MMATSASGVAITFIGLPAVLALMTVGEEITSVMFDLMEMELLQPLMGLAVLVSWVTLLAGRRWRAEPSWVDRFGRAVGVYWILAGFAVTGLFVLRDHNVCSFYVRTVDSPPAAERGP
jgi:hypothetical protein